MPSLTDHPWQAKYSRDHGNLVEQFYIPALQCAQRYWRTTGYFQAAALSLALRGIEGLIHNQGTMRLIVGCTLGAAEIQAIEKGQSLQATVEYSLQQTPLEPPDQAAHDALELLAWMVQHQILAIKIAVPCDAQRRPHHHPEIFHEKAGILEDTEGNRIAFNGSLNETPNGWLNNWESFHVFTSWQTPDHVNAEDQSFHELWIDQSPRALVLDIPQAIHDRLLTYAPPPGQRPKRLQASEHLNSPYIVSPPPEPPQPVVPIDPRAIVWSYLRNSPKYSPQGDWVGAATSAVDPWPHQIRAFQRMWNQWPPKLLIADEVGLGKTIQAGLLLRQAWISGRAQRILIMAPASVLKQWQLELREKFNLHWPIYDGKALHWYPSLGSQNDPSRPISRAQWHTEPFVLVSSHLMRRRDRVLELLEQSAPWDLIVLDEAHHARRQGGTPTKIRENRQNRLLSLMQRLKDRTQGLLLLTATPMQVDPIEVWDLLQLLKMPPEWTAPDFLRFFEIANHGNPSKEQFTYLARLFQAIERDFGEIDFNLAKRLVPQRSNLQTKKILKALRSDSSIPLQQLETLQREAALKILLAHTPVRTLISRHTRQLLRRYYAEGKISTPIAQRDVQDIFITLSDPERHVYDAVEDYISSTYNNAAAGDRNAVGFVMTIYRKRLASSFYALSQTLENRLSKLKQPDPTLVIGPTLEEDLPDDTLEDDTPDLDEAIQLEIQALNLEESSDLEDLLTQIRALSVDTKTQKLKELLVQLQSEGYSQAIVFTQFTDTLNFLRQELIQSLNLEVMCFSGRGGEIYQGNGLWKTISREATKQRFAQGKAEIMLCTDAAAEGLNFQFCGALINYDMPWNPMRVEQRIGRIDRLGQKYPTIRIYHLHYSNTVETDVYLALQERIKLFQAFVGQLQPILSRISSSLISNLVLSRREERQNQQEALFNQMDLEAGLNSPTPSFDLDKIIQEDWLESQHPEPAYTLKTLRLILLSPKLLPPGITVKSSGSKDFSYTAPGMTNPIRVTTDPLFYDEHSDSVELWSPGNPLFPNPDIALTEVDAEAFRQAIASESPSK